MLGSVRHTCRAHCLFSVNNRTVKYRFIYTNYQSLFIGEWRIRKLVVWQVTVKQEEKLVRLLSNKKRSYCQVTVKQEEKLLSRYCQARGEVSVRLLSRTRNAQARGEAARSRKLCFCEYFSAFYTTTRLCTRVTTGILENPLRF